MKGFIDFIACMIGIVLSLAIIVIVVTPVFILVCNYVAWLADKFDL